MPRIESALFDIGALDELARRDTAVHRLDPRAKVVVTLVFVVSVVSFDKYAVSPLLPFALFPVVLIAAADLPPRVLLQRLLPVLPFALLVGIFNPLIDREVQMYLGPVAVSGGWISFASIVARVLLTAGAALVLVATTGFAAICMALERMGTPRVFALQLLFLYRYLFVLLEEGGRMHRARTLRSFRGRGMGPRVFGHLIGQLLLRTLDRAQRIHRAMLGRGFDGEIRLLRPLRIGRREVVFVLGWSAFFVLARLVDLPAALGTFLAELLP